MKKNAINHKKSINLKKLVKSQNKISGKLKSKKSYENTASTLGSRSSMDSKLTKNRQNTHLSHNSASAFGLMQQRKSTAQQCLFLPLNQNHTYENNFVEEGSISYREYCIMDGRWIPLLTNTQRQRIIFPLNSNTEKKQVENIVINNANQNVSKPQFTTTPNIQNIQKTFQKLQQQINQNLTFQNISIQSKNYYCNILKTVMQKLHYPNISKIDINFQQNERQNEQKTMENLYQSDLLNQQRDDQISPVKFFQLEKDLQKLEQLDVVQVIKMRELKQMGMLPDWIIKNETQAQQKKEKTINTNIKCVEQYVSKLVQTIVGSKISHYIVNHIKTAWGWPKKEKLAKIRTNKYLGSTMDALPDYLFQLIEDTYGQDCLYQFIHNRCLFDYINSELCKLKPFYDSNGQTFPWNFKLGAPLTFFQVEQSSLNLALDEVKLKLMQSCNMLCGILVEVDVSNPQYHLVSKRRQEKEDLMCRKYLLAQQYKNQQDNALENETTLSLIKISDLIMQDLLIQWQQQIK